MTVDELSAIFPHISRSQLLENITETLVYRTMSPRWLQKQLTDLHNLNRVESGEEFFKRYNLHKFLHSIVSRTWRESGLKLFRKRNFLLTILNVLTTNWLGGGEESKLTAEVCETPEINTVTGKTRGGRMLESSVLSDSAYQEKVTIHNLLLVVLIVISAVT
ncbi:hypothetical protein J6590_080871 [Homalodisca vitripennis]|nr:hypothetical protein J6590_080871 [Homalodisca vitripennis]